MLFKEIKKLSFLFISICIFSSSELLSLDLREKNNIYSSSPVLRINTAGNSGSGVVIGRKNNLYTIITARHVVDSSILEEIEISISESVYAKALRMFDPFPEKDLVIIQFKHFGDIDLALMPYLDQIFWNKIANWPAIKVEGIANPTEAIPEPTRRKNIGQIINLLENHIDGYNLVHDANTNVGMSGGAIYGIPDGNVTYLKKELNSESNLFEYSTQEEYSDFTNKRYSQISNYYTEMSRIGRQSGSVKIATSEINKSDLITDQEKKIFSMCLSGTLEQKHLPKLNNKNKKIIEGLLNPRTQRTSYKISDCFSKTLQLTNSEREWGNIVVKDVMEFCTISHYRLKNLLLAIHGRSEAYAYGGKSGIGIGIFLGQEDIIEWFNVNGRQLGIPLTDGSQILDFLCNNKDKYYQTNFYQN
tara:strand:- start:82 stop:1332 length:1251 start_codon:yes stop_codon:yes gene_type:complete